MTFKIFARTDKSTKNGTPLIFIIQPGTHKVSTGYSCREGSWNQLSQSVITTGKKKDPKAPHLNARLKRASIKLQEILDKTHDIKLIRDEYSKWIHNQLEGGPVDESEETFKEMVDNLIKSHRTDWSASYKNRFTSIVTKILEYDPYFHINKLTEEWHREFVSWCTEERGNRSNTIYADKNMINILMKELGKPNIKVKWNRVDTEKEGLAWEKVLKIRDLEVPDESDTIKDSHTLWLAGALTGRRWSEILSIAPENFYRKGDGKWWYKNVGKRNKIIDIPLLPEAVEFFERIGAFKPGFRMPQIPNAAVNLDIKRIAEKAGLNEKMLIIIPISPNKVIKKVKEEWQTVTIHTGRHSYCQYIAGKFTGREGAEKTVSWLMGHASFVTTWRYLNRSAGSKEKLFEEVIGG